MLLLSSQLRSPEEAFSFAHEQAHVLFGQLLSVSQRGKNHAAAVHCTVQLLAQDEHLSAEHVEHLWRAFNAENMQLLRTARLVEPIEEVAADYVALKAVPRLEKPSVTKQVRSVLAARGLLNLYVAFESTCDAWEGDRASQETDDRLTRAFGGYPLTVEVPVSVFVLAEIIGDCTLKAGVFSTESAIAAATFLRPLYAYLGALGGEPASTARMGQPIEEASSQMGASFSSSLLRAMGRENTSSSDLEPIVPRIVLVGRDEGIDVLLYPDDEDAVLSDAVYWESLRQQLQCAAGFACPLAPSRGTLLRTTRPLDATVEAASSRLTVWIQSP